MAPGDTEWLQVLLLSPWLHLPGSTAGFTALGCSHLHAHLPQVEPHMPHTQEGTLQAKIPSKTRASPGDTPESL